MSRLFDRERGARSAALTLAGRWSDLDWLNGTLSVQRGIVRQRVDDVKTETSHKAITVTGTMLAALKTWRQTTQFSAQEDWIFVSPAQIGRLPWSADSINDAYKKAASAAKVPRRLESGGARS